MSPTWDLISKSLILLGLCLSLGACASTQAPPPPASQLQPKTRIYYADYDLVWRSTQLAMSRYPMAISNIDTGVVETDFIKGSDGWNPPNARRPASPGMRYKIQLRLARGIIDEQEAVRVTVLKRSEIQRDFFSKPEMIPSDGLEEQIILYRIERELVIETALREALDEADFLY